MIFPRRYVFLSALFLSSLLLFSGCKPKTPQPDNQNAQQAQSTQNAQPNQSTPQPQQGYSGAPAAGSSGGGTPMQQGANAPQGSQVSNAAPAMAAQVPPSPPPPTVVTLPSGSRIRVRLVQDLGSKISKTGDSFSATVADDIRVSGNIIIPMGSRAEGTVVDAKPLGRFKGGADLALRLDQVHTNWGRYAVSTSTIDRAEKGKGKRTAGFIGGGTGLGAIIGGIAGGGKGAAIGALAGAGAGTAGSAFTGNKNIVLPAETILTFKLDHEVHITEQK